MKIGRNHIVLCNARCATCEGLLDPVVFDRSAAMFTDEMPERPVVCPHCRTDLRVYASEKMAGYFKDYLRREATVHRLRNSMGWPAPVFYSRHVLLCTENPGGRLYGCAVAGTDLNEVQVLATLNQADAHFQVLGVSAMTFASIMEAAPTELLTD